jgi:hypothetical protein
MRQFFAGLVLKFLLGRMSREPAPVTAAPVRRRTAQPRVQPTPDAPPRRSPLLVVMLTCLVLGLPLMLIFENTYTRIAGVLLCFGFIVSGVFVIANPVDLGKEAE